MNYGHKKTQDNFMQLGKRLGYAVRRSWSRDLPTDGVWLTDCPLSLDGQIPFVAAEVLASEKGKVILGSLATLERVNPAIALVIIADDEYRRRLYKKGMGVEDVEVAVANFVEKVRAAVSGRIQRFKVCTASGLERRFVNV